MRAQNPPSVHWRIGTSILAAALGLAVVGCGDDERSAAKAQVSVTQSTEADPDRSLSGLRAYVDPDTGELTVPSALDVQNLDLQISAQAAMEQARNYSHEGLSAETLADGTVKLDLQGRFQSQVFASIGADGELDVSHRPEAAADAAAQSEEASHDHR